ncbi:MAG TPA: ATP12 family protein [Hyphomicrobiales bacterium]|nr:ATP12 family protein [Hyphomicrobiales bacterium]
MATDPLAGLRASTRPSLPRRFYTRVAVVAGEDGYAIALDDRPVKTPARRPLAVADAALAEALAAEWEAQEEVVDPTAMPLNRLVNSALDAVAANIESVRAEVVKYAASDLLCYRAEGPLELARRQGAAWDPVLAWARDERHIHLNLAAGVMFVEQPEAALEAVRHEVAALDPLALAALHVMTTLTGSALLALAVLHGQLDAGAAWLAAQVDEDWNAEKWGLDEEAARRTARRRREMEAAARLLALLRG